MREAKGQAWVVENARLNVSFFWPFRGEYWIINLGQEYEYAVIGAPPTLPQFRYVSPLACAGWIVR